MYIRCLLAFKFASVWVPVMMFYHVFVDNQFFNAACEKSSGLEKAADILLVPYQYALTGRIAHEREDGSWSFQPRFDYSSYFWTKNIPCWILAPVSLAAGGALKTLAYALSSDMQHRYEKLKKPQPVHLNNEMYREMGLFDENPISSDLFVSQQILRQPGSEEHLAAAKAGLKEIGKKLTEAGILWWVDCGTCLGAYRHGGIIPWDYDVDIAILEPDFENVYNLLRGLDPEIYRVFDLSSRDRPMSLMKVVLRKQPECEIDIYHFRINPEARSLSFILSQENHLFLPESWKTRERPFKTPTKFEDVFPLQPAMFDGIAVFVPNNIIRYLARVYGENLAPAKKYNPETGEYEKDLTHSYWQRPFAH